MLKRSVKIAKKTGIWGSHFVIWCCVAVMTVFVLLQLALWSALVWINTDSGQQLLQSLLGQQLKGTAYSVDFDGFSYALPTRVGLGDVTIYEGEHTVLEAKGVSLDLDVFPVVNKHIRVFLTINEATLYPRAEGQRTEKDTNTSKTTLQPILISSMELPDLYFNRITLADVSIETLTIKQEDGKRDLILSPKLAGEIHLVGDSVIEAGLSFKRQKKQGQAPNIPSVVDVGIRYEALRSKLVIEKIVAKSEAYTARGRGDAVFQKDGAINMQAKLTPHKIDDLRPVSASLSLRNVTGLPADVRVKGRYREKPIDITAKSRMSGDMLQFKTLSITVPDFHLSGDVALDTMRNIVTGKISGTLESLSAYQTFIGTDHTIKPLSFSADFEVSSGGQSATIKASSPYYMNRAAGLVFRDIDLDATYQDNSLRITRLTARDKQEGTIQASGRYNIKTREVNADVKAEKIRALKGDIASGILSLDLSVSGQDNAYDITGRIAPERIEIQLPEQFTQNIPSLNVVKKDRIRKKDPAKAVKQEVSLDITVDAPQQVFVRGWGLDAEFGGKIKISGTLDEAIYNGNLSVIRGRYNEFGKNFKITRGDLNFRSTVPPSPYLDIVTQTTTDEVTAKIIIDGPATKPDISFASVPPLPEDEVLSHILFGKDMGSITPFQAVKLTQTLQRFSGQGGSGFDPVGALRDLTGLDDLNVESAQGGGATVGAGKYISEKVYLEFETGSEEGSSNANIEVEVSPHVTIESEIGADAQGGGGVFWKWDY